MHAVLIYSVVRISNT